VTHLNQSQSDQPISSAQPTTSTHKLAHSCAVYVSLLYTYTQLIFWLLVNMKTTWIGCSLGISTGVGSRRNITACRRIG